MIKTMDDCFIHEICAVDRLRDRPQVGAAEVRVLFAER